MELKIKFQDLPDTPSPTIDLSKNNVLFGLNGHGKTRILKTIEKLSRISKSGGNREFLTLIDSLNIESLTINKIDHTELLTQSNKIQGNINLNLKHFINKNDFAIYDCIASLRYIATTLEDIPFSPSREIRRFAARIEEMAFEGPRRIRVTRLPPLQSLRSTLNSSTNFLNTTLRNLESFNEVATINVPHIYRQIHESIEIHKYLLEKINDIEYDTLSEDESLVSAINSKKDKLIDSLSNEKFRYISSEYSELEKIKQYIENKISSEIASDFLSQWDSKSALTKFPSIIDTKNNFATASQKLFELAGIEISLSKDLELTFSKNSEILEVDKLSSGEKRVSALILNSIFAEENCLLIDEPEVSLSLNYQNLIIGILVDLAPDKKFILATHAPYIFESCENYKFNLVEV